MSTGPTEKSGYVKTDRSSRPDDKDSVFCRSPAKFCAQTPIGLSASLFSIKKSPLCGQAAQGEFKILKLL